MYVWAMIYIQIKKNVYWSETWKAATGICSCIYAETNTHWHNWSYITPHRTYIIWMKLKKNWWKKVITKTHAMTIFCVGCETKTHEKNGKYFGLSRILHLLTWFKLIIKYFRYFLMIWNSFDDNLLAKRKLFYLLYKSIKSTFCTISPQ